MTTFVAKNVKNEHVIVLKEDLGTKYVHVLVEKGFNNILGKPYTGSHDLLRIRRDKLPPKVLEAMRARELHVIEQLKTLEKHMAQKEIRVRDKQEQLMDAVTRMQQENANEHA